MFQNFKKSIRNVKYKMKYTHARMYAKALTLWRLYSIKQQRYCFRTIVVAHAWKTRPISEHWLGYTRDFPPLQNALSILAYPYPCDELTSSCRLVLASVPWRARAGLEIAFLFLGVVPKQKTDWRFIHIRCRA